MGARLRGRHGLRRSSSSSYCDCEIHTLPVVLSAVCLSVVYFSLPSHFNCLDIILVYQIVKKEQDVSRYRSYLVYRGRAADSVEQWRNCGGGVIFKTTL